MTIDKILARHGLTRDDVSQVITHTEYNDDTQQSVTVDMEWEKPERDYCLVSHELMDYDEWSNGLNSYFDVQIIGYYPRINAYLVKRKNAISPHDIKIVYCDSCREYVSDNEWDFLETCCKKCSVDRSRWLCKGCGENLGYDNTPRKENEIWLRPRFCSECANKSIEFQWGRIWRAE